MMYSALLVTWLFLFNQHLVRKTFGYVVESDEDIDEAIIDTTELTIANNRIADDDVISHKTIINKNETLADTSDSAEDDIIELNIGGERITTLRSTLTAIPGSKLALMFAKDTSINAKSNNKETTSFFFDYDPDTFKILLNKLRRIKRMTSFIPYEHQLQNSMAIGGFGYSDLIVDLELTDKHFLSPVNGFHLNLNMSSLVGWKECYRSKYDKPFNISILNDTCTGSQLLVACRSVKNQSILTVAGVNKREDIFRLCPKDSICEQRNLQTPSFYHVADRIWGFQGCPQNGCTKSSSKNVIRRRVAPSHQDSDLCDSNYYNVKYRLCWSMSTNVDRIDKDRCGNVKTLHYSKEWERLIFQTN